MVLPTGEGISLRFSHLCQRTHLCRNVLSEVSFDKELFSEQLIFIKNRGDSLRSP